MKIASFPKHKQVDCVRRKMLFTIFKYLFSFQRYCKLAKWWRHTINLILFKYDEKRYLSQFVSEMFVMILCSKILLKVTSHTKTFLTVSRFITDSRSPAVHLLFEWTGMPFERLELSVLKNSSSVRTVRAIRSRKLISSLNGSSYPFKKNHQPFEQLELSVREIHQPFEWLKLSVREIHSRSNKTRLAMLC